MFRLATSELSQDSFIIWLLNFTKDEFSREDEGLTICARELLAEMILGAGIQLIDSDKETIKVVESARQFLKVVDVYVKVATASGQLFSVVIEDKTYTSEHGNQISRYIDTVSKETNLPTIGVYYKTIDEAVRKREKVAYINRQKLIAIFSKYLNQTQNSIFHDYVDYLNELETKHNNFKVLPISQWNDDCFRGFYHFISGQQSDAVKPLINIENGYGYSYVPNQQGGFWGCYWYWLRGEHLNPSGLEQHIGSLYLQMEKNMILIKIENEAKKSPEHTLKIRKKLYNYLASRDKRIMKPTRFAPGKYMSVAFVNYDHENYEEIIKLMENLMSEVHEGKFYY